jgi:hypothetical protein
MPIHNSNGRNHAVSERQPNTSATTDTTEHGENSTTGNSLGALIAEAHALRDFLRDGYNRAGRLCNSLKRHRKQFKLANAALASLRQLQQIQR